MKGLVDLVNELEARKVHPGRTGNRPVRRTRRGPKAPDDRLQGSGGKKAIGERHAATGGGAQLRRVGSYVIPMVAGLLYGCKASRLEASHSVRTPFVTELRSGRLAGQHGIGCGKITFLVAEHGDAMSVMRAIKKAIEPDNIMKPGKILRI